MSLKIHASDLAPRQPLTEVVTKDPMWPLSKSETISHLETKDGRLVFWNGPRFLGPLNVTETRGPE